MKIKRQNKVIAILCVVAMLFAQSAFAVFAETSVDPTITMTEGAYVRVDTDGSGVTGLKFEATVAQTTVDTWVSENDSVQFGMLIMPADYATSGKELSEENVFGANAIYTYSGDTSDTTGKTYIINVAYGKNTLKVDGDNYVIHGTISSVNYYNLDRSFVALAYAKLTKDGTDTYVMADYVGGDSAKNTRSAVYVANAAYLSDAVTDEAVNDWCLDIIDTSLSYRVNAVKNITPTADNLAYFDAKYAKVLALTKTIDATIFNQIAVAEDIEKINASVETAIGLAEVSSVSMSGTSTTVPTGAVELSQTVLETVKIEGSWATLGQAFKAFLADNADKDIVLTSDIDLAGSPIAAAIEFTGTIDGQGYSIKNFNLNGHSGSDNGHIAYLFKSNSGTIKNIGFIFNAVAVVNDNALYLFHENTGTLENIYIDVTYNASTGGAYTFMNILACQKSVVGTFKNIVINMHQNDGVELTAQSFGAIAYTNAAGNVVENVHVISNGAQASCGTPMVVSYNYAPITLTECGTYADMAAFVEAVTVSETSGWASVWNNLDANGNVIDNSKYENISTSGIVEDSTLPEGAITLSMENAGTSPAFAALLAATPDGHFVLTEDLDWTGVEGRLTSNINFSGTLDGQGYVIKGMSIDNWGNNATSATGGTNHAFESNSGTIKNIGFIYNLVERNTGNNEVALIKTNYGTVENVYVDCTLTGSIQGTYKKVGAISSSNESTGMIKNCVVKVEVASDVTIVTSADGDFPAMGIITGYNKGTIKDSYAINDDGLKLAMFASWSGGTEENAVKYETVAAMLEEVTSFDTADGWASYWSIESDDVKFAHVDIVPDTTVDVTINVGEGATLTSGASGKVEAGTELTFAVGTDAYTTVAEVTLNGQVITLKADGVYTVYIKEDSVIEIKTEIDSSIILLSMENAGTSPAFAALLAATPDGHFVLTEDLDWTGVEGRLTSNINFSGTLDGQGYVIKGMSIDNWGNNATSATGGTNHAFESNSGTIKNIGFIYNLVERNSGNNEVALIKDNYGTVENVYVDCALTGSIQGTYKKVGAISSNNASTGMIKNCVVKVEVASDVTIVTSADGDFPAMGIITSYNRGTIKDSYAINDDGLKLAMFASWSGGKEENAVKYETVAAMLEEVTSFDTADGWASYWSIVDGEVVFGN